MKLRYTLRGAAELKQLMSDLAEKSQQGSRNVNIRIQAIINLLLLHP